MGFTGRLSITDVDGDGYAPCEGDCDDSDLRTPRRAEVCGDSIDNDCDGATTPYLMGTALRAVPGWIAMTTLNAPGSHRTSG